MSPRCLIRSGPLVLVLVLLLVLVHESGDSVNEDEDEDEDDSCGLRPPEVGDLGYSVRRPPL